MIDETKAFKGLQGQASISCPSGSGADYITIQLEDRLSGCRVTEIRIKYADFARALTGLGNVACEFDLYTANIGKRREVKEERICVPHVGFAYFEKAAADAVMALNVDGWIGRPKDALNQHRLIERTEEGRWYRVSYVRFVDDDDPAPHP